MSLPAPALKFDSPVRNRIEQFARSGAALPPAPHDSAARPGAATTAELGASAAEFIPYGPPESDGGRQCEILATLGEIELEYAAIRRGAALFDAPHRGTILVTGSDRRDFLNRMLTQDLRNLAPGSAATAFWLNRKGRIEADLLLAELGDSIVIDLDVTNAEATASALNNFLFADDVQLRDASHELHRLQLHGPDALAVLQRAIGKAEAPALEHNRATATTFAGGSVTIVRHDLAGEPGFHIAIERDRAADFWQALVDAGARPIGWYALNIARIEAGTPIFNIDFGPTNLPHETGLVAHRVSFKKGCYIGQEIVARMQNLGAPKQMLTGLKMQSDHLPVAGAAVFEIVEGALGDRAGVVTSSTISPMNSAQPIAFAMLRSPLTPPGTVVMVHAEGAEARAETHALTFWTRGGAT